MTYGNHNGLHISRAIPTELVGRAVLSQGTGSHRHGVDSAISAARSSSSPRAPTASSASTSRRCSAAIPRAARSRASTAASSARARAPISRPSIPPRTSGRAAATRRHAHVQLQGSCSRSATATLTGYYNYSDRAEIDYQDLSKDIVARRGHDWDNWFPNWNAAIAAANACNGERRQRRRSSATTRTGMRRACARIDLGYLALDLPLGESLEWKTTAYGHQQRRPGPVGHAVRADAGRRAALDSHDRVRPRSAWRADGADLDGRQRTKSNGGVWYETNDFTQARRFYGEPSIAGADARLRRTSRRNPFLTDWEYDFDTESYRVPSAGHLVGHATSCA